MHSRKSLTKESLFQLIYASTEAHEKYFVLPKWGDCLQPQYNSRHVSMSAASPYFSSDKSETMASPKQLLCRLVDMSSRKSIISFPQAFSRHGSPNKFKEASRVIPHIIASDITCATRPSHVRGVSDALQKSGILKVSLQFPDDRSQYLQNLILSLHRHHGHGLPITHSASRGWFWDIRPNSVMFQTPSHQARSETMQDFPWHTDCSYEEAPPRYFALQVLREDRCGGGTLSVMNVGKLTTLLSPPARAVLQRPEFCITVPPEFVKEGGKKHIIGGLLARDANGAPSMVRFREDITTALSVEAGAALAELKSCLMSAEVQAQTVHLTPDCLRMGSVVLLDNCRWLHARTEV